MYPLEEQKKCSHSSILNRLEKHTYAWNTKSVAPLFTAQFYISSLRSAVQQTKEWAIGLQEFKNVSYSGIDKLERRGKLVKNFENRPIIQKIVWIVYQNTLMASYGKLDKTWNG